MAEYRIRYRQGGQDMAKARTIEQILRENGLAFAPNMEEHYMSELENIWNEACRESGGEVTDAQIDEYLKVLKNMGLAIPVHKENIEREKSRKSSVAPDPEILKMRRIIQDEKAADLAAKRASKKAKEVSKASGPGIAGCGPMMFTGDEGDSYGGEDRPDPDEVYRIFPTQSKTDLGHTVFLILDIPEGVQVPHRIAGGFTNPERRLAFEYYDGEERYHMSRLDMSGADIRFRKMFSWLGEHHISVNRNDIGYDRHRRRSAHPLYIIRSAVRTFMKPCLSCHDIGGSDIKLHRIVFESFRVERIELLRHRMIAELSAVQITGLYQRLQAAVAPVPAVFLIVSDRSSDLV